MCLTTKTFKGQTSHGFLNGLGGGVGVCWSSKEMEIKAPSDLECHSAPRAPAEMKAEELVENDFLVAASTFNFLN